MSENPCPVEGAVRIDISQGKAVLRGIGPKKPRRKATVAERQARSQKLVAGLSQQQAVESVPTPHSARPPAKKDKGRGRKGLQ